MRGRLNWSQLGYAREWSCHDMIVWLAAKPWSSSNPSLRVANHIHQCGGLKFVDLCLVSEDSRVCGDSK
jgi:hypothetical protein